MITIYGNTPADDNEISVFSHIYHEILLDYRVFTYFKVTFS